MRPDLETKASKTHPKTDGFSLKLVKGGSSVSLSRHFKSDPSPHGDRSQKVKFRTAFSPQECRHNFAVARFSKLSRFRAQAYLYTCLRCKWAFRVNDPVGSIVPLNPDGEALPEPFRSERIQTFADGPCPSFRF
jgi:hypothetical protein